MRNFTEVLVRMYLDLALHHPRPEKVLRFYLPFPYCRTR